MSVVLDNNKIGVLNLIKVHPIADLDYKSIIKEY